MIRFPADASLRHAIVSGCLRREPAIDMAGIPDAEVLALAAAEGRMPITSDIRPMPKHFGERLASGGSSAGVLLVKQHTPVADGAVQFFCRSIGEHAVCPRFTV